MLQLKTFGSASDKEVDRFPCVPSHTQLVNADLKYGCAMDSQLQIPALEQVLPAAVHHYPPVQEGVPRSRCFCWPSLSIILQKDSKINCNLTESKWGIESGKEKTQLSGNRNTFPSTSEGSFKIKQRLEAGEMVHGSGACPALAEDSVWFLASTL